MTGRNRGTREVDTQILTGTMALHQEVMGGTQNHSQKTQSHNGLMYHQRMDRMCLQKSKNLRGHYANTRIYY